MSKKIKRDTAVRTTIRVPRELATFAEKQARGPRHAGSLSSYVRSLIIRDLEAAGKN